MWRQSTHVNGLLVREGGWNLAAFHAEYSLNDVHGTVVNEYLRHRDRQKAFSCSKEEHSDASPNSNIIMAFGGGLYPKLAYFLDMGCPGNPTHYPGVASAMSTS